MIEMESLKNRTKTTVNLEASIITYLRWKL